MVEVVVLAVTPCSTQVDPTKNMVVDVWGGYVRDPSDGSGTPEELHRQVPLYPIVCAVKATILGHILSPFGDGLGGF